MHAGMTFCLAAAAELTDSKATMTDARRVNLRTTQGAE